VWRTMTKYLLLYLLLTSVRGAEPPAETRGYVVKVGLVADDPAFLAAVPEETISCHDVTFTLNLRYGASEQNVLGVATSSTSTDRAFPRPVLLFVAGESFSTELQHLMGKPRCRMRRCALPRATEWSALQ
jgi:hypothetical protein